MINIITNYYKKETENISKLIMKLFIVIMFEYIFFFKYILNENYETLNTN